MVFINPNVEAKYWHSDGKEVVCDLCPHRCRLPVGAFGRCSARKNVDGKLVAYSYGRISSIAVDPIEKKPLYHFHPGTRIFSVGGVGCNMHCRYCQNYSISMSSIGKKRTTFKSPEDLVALCRQQKFDQIAFTYNEPGIWIEYILDVMACDPDLDLVLVTNGLLNEQPLKDLCKVTKAMNIDVKAFNDRFYDNLCGAKLDDVKKSCKTVFDAGVHLELTYLVIPGYNDKHEELLRFITWVRDTLSPDVPVHFTRFHPDYEMINVPMTPVETLLLCKSDAEENGLNYAYVGNVLADDATDTYCPECGAAVIKRTGYMVDIVGLDSDRCAACKHKLNIVP
ncbi:MAG: AmmeMemoRadiSam system radical SAM enzyme [Candidatus Methanomethylophilus sp.]|nr:AmmeMemoRadiSam system radical SAM enzyme [Methanomethylophilus sp.]MDD3233389.1 AmmeMemoRadiSam system radical SAM enzyme [Methanomethylophilus sp.]MDD4221950.1 AmmeMemoRadiSam system radical SAM enzyme [Methanomethylophilus sp.]MDD4668771.1 AmmeMemoRadiSam system radical SAM enzyme [Methanomethylophilus sp.]